MRRQKRKNTQKRHTLLVLFILTLIVSMICAGSNINKTNKLATSVDGAGEPLDSESNSPLTPNQILTSAVEVALGSQAYDCSGYIKAVMDHLGAEGIVNSTDTWNKDAQRYTYQGQTYKPTLIASATRASGEDWYNAKDESGKTIASYIKPGDFICGDNHIILFVGKEENGLDAIHTTLQTVSGKQFSFGNTTGQMNSGCFDFGNCYGPYYYIAGNVPAIRPRLENYDWDDSNGNPTKPDKTFKNLKVFRIAGEPKHKGMVGLYKYIDQNNDGKWNEGEPALKGAKFKLATDAECTNFVKNGDSDYEVTTDPDGKAKFENIDLGTETTATFYLKETHVPEGYSMKNSITQVTVKESGYDMNDISTLVQIGNDINAHKGMVGLYKYIDQNNDGKWNEGERALDGAKFKLAKNADGTDFVKKDGSDYEVTTKDGGKAKFEDIDLGTETTATFYLVETHVPEGYSMKNSITQVTVKESGYDMNDISTLVQIGNDEVKNKGKVGVYKYEDVNGNGKWDQEEPALSGAKFKLARNADGTDFVKKDGSDYEVTTGENGSALFEDIDIGAATEKTFYLVETKAPDGFNLIKNPITAVAKSADIDYTDISNLINIGNKKKIYDLALRKYITAVKDGATGEEKTITDRIPNITVPENFNTEKCTTLKYEHTKEPVVVHTTDIVTYNIEIFNEGPEDAYANIIKDDIPAGLEFVKYTEGDGSINDKHHWKMVDADDNEVDDVSKAKYIVTNYLDIDDAETNLIKAFNPDTMKKPDSRIVQVQFKVTEPTTSDRIVINQAQIAKETDADGNVVKDRDSTPNEWLGEDDEDIEKVRVLYFDLALRKWVVEAIVTKDGKETIYQTGHKAEDNPESVVKVDLKKSDLSKVTVKFKYKIRITNHGQIPGEAKVVRDDIPEGLKFVKEDNPDWREENGKIVTDKLANVTLQPGESTEMEIILTWINGENNLSVKTNISEIEEDHNIYGAHDIDSTPGNKKSGEDDIDNAPVMLAIKTGSEIIKYIALVAGILAFIGISITIIKRKVLNN